MKEYLERTDRFMDVFGISNEDTIANRNLQFGNLLEEVLELGFAMGLGKFQIAEVLTDKFKKVALKQLGEDNNYDRKETLDALVDIMYFVPQIMRITNLQDVFEEAFDRVHGANMAKMIDGRIMKDERGKVMKPEGWKAADLSDLVGIIKPNTITTTLYGKEAKEGTPTQAHL